MTIAQVILIIVGIIIVIFGLCAAGGLLRQLTAPTQPNGSGKRRDTLDEEERRTQLGYMALVGLAIGIGLIIYATTELGH